MKNTAEELVKKIQNKVVANHNRLYEKGCTRWGFIITGRLQSVTYETRKRARETVIYRLGTKEVHLVKLHIKVTA